VRIKIKSVNKKLCAQHARNMHSFSCSITTNYLTIHLLWYKNYFTNHPTSK